MLYSTCMNCPNDNTTLLITDRNGIEIDYCPTCRGVWLDRGELDKLIERAGHPQVPTYHDQVRHEQPRSHSEYSRENKHGYRASHHDNQYDSHYQDRHQKHKRENFLEDFFDFG